MPEHSPGQVEQRLDAFQRDWEAITEQLQRVIVGQREVIAQTLTALLAGGHALLEGVPGLGKTLLVRTLADALDLNFSRIQFTPDLMPADITGTNIITTEDGQRGFRFQPGPVFAHLVLADEINRATPKTQSAILEAMQEHTVSVARTSHCLPEPFFVLATQNPLEMEGTYPLPEAQLDRFLLKIHLAPPPQEDLVEILDRTTGPELPAARMVADARRIVEMQQIVREVPAPVSVKELIARLVLATHPGCQQAPQPVRRYVRYGASPRGAQALLLAAKVRALCHGRPNVSRADVQAFALPVLRHRVLLSFEGQAEAVGTDDLIREALHAAETDKS